MSEDEDRVARAIADDLAADPPSEDLARTRRRFLQAQRQSVSTAAAGEQPAVQARYWVAVPWRPEVAIKERFKAACSPPTAGAPHELASSPARRARQPALHRADRRPARRPGHRPAHRRARRNARACCGSACTPPRAPCPDFDALDQVAQIVQADSPAAGRRAPPADPRRDHQRPRAGRHRRNATGAFCATPTARWRRRCTSAPCRRKRRRGGWRTCCRSHCRAPSRSTSRSVIAAAPATASARRWARLRAAVSYKERRGQLVGSDEEDALDEAAAARPRAPQHRRRDRLPGRDVRLLSPARWRQHGVRRAAEDDRPRVSIADRRQGPARRVSQRAELSLHAADRRRPAARDADLCAAQHRALLTASDRGVRLPRRPDPRLLRPRRHARAPRPV